MPQQAHVDEDRPSFRELSFAGMATAAGIIAILFAVDAQSRLTHPLWLDECITSLIANDDRFAHMLRAIHGGAENNPPTFYLILWPIARLFNGLGTVGLRVVAGVATLAALIGVYATARLFVDRSRAAIGALAVAAHPIVIAQMFEARFYGTWLAATTWFAFAMSIQPSESNERRVLAWRCGLAVVVATMHWFGILVVLLIVAGAAVRARFAPGQPASTPLSRAAPAVCALVGVALCSPFLISQRSGLSVPTWIEATTGEAVVAMAYRLFVTPGALLAAGIVVLPTARLFGFGRRGTAEVAALAPFWMLLLFPVLITTLSFLLQPLLYERYLIPSALPLGILAAWSLPVRPSRIRVLLLGSAAAVLVIAMGREMRWYSRAVSITDWRIRNALRAVDRVVDSGGPRPVIFVRRHEQYPVIQQRPELAGSVALIDFDGEPDSLMPRTIFERDMARRINHFYPSHRLVRLGSIERGSAFIVITSANEEAELRRLLAGFTVLRQEPDVYYVSRK